ncbi:MAG TPA: type I secretion system permease/ATPase [Rhodospirillaceae bacterium]|nr:type I secretion system permease/ATPase [Rhodospirillaceae bacterium]
MQIGQIAKPESVDTGLICLGLMLRYFQLPNDPQQLRHDYGKMDGPFDAVDIVRCAKRAGLLARSTESRWKRLEHAPLPAIAQMKDGSFVIFARFLKDAERGDRVFVHDPRLAQPEFRTAEDIAAQWDGTLILTTHREALSGPARTFDLSWFIPAVIRYRRLFGEVLLASFFLQLMGLVSPMFFQVVTDKVLVHRGLSSLTVLMIGMSIVSAFEVVLGALRTYVFSHTTSRIDVELGAALFRHLMGLPLAYFAARPAGTTVARVRDLDTIRNFLTGTSLTLVIDAFFTIVFFVVMFFYSVPLTLIVLASIPFYLGLSVVVTPVLKKRIDTKFQHAAANQAFLVEAVTAAETCKAMAVEPQMQRKWESLLAAYTRSSFRVQNLGNVSSQIAQGISKIQSVALLWLGAEAVMDGELTVGGLIAFNMLAGRVTSPILRLAQTWQDFQQLRVSVAWLGDILNTPTERNSQARSGLPSMDGRVTFENVTFRYRPDRPEVLRRLSLDVQPGETIGLVGSSGSGKSTLTKLVQRLYVPESGRILIDGVDLGMIDTAWLRRQVGVVLQENVLFSRSIRDNIAVANPSAPLEAVVAAAKMAAAHDFICELPEAYDTLVGERGSSLSGGQRQRIAIARALLNNPKVLIFDEATSALDYESEAQIRQNMAAIGHGRTMFIIAHRLSAVRHCDRIVVIEKGEISEQGSHDQLMASGGRYAFLWHCQEVGHVDG